MGLITATVVMSIVAITSLIFAAIFAAGASKAAKDLADLQTKYRDVARDPNGPTVAELKTRRGVEGSPFTNNDQLIDVAVGERDAMLKWVGGANATAAAANAAAAATTAADAMKAAGQTETSKTENLAATLSVLANTIKTQHEQIVALTKTVADTSASAAKTVKDTQDALAVKDQAIADANKGRDEALAKADAATKGNADVASASQKVIEEANQKHAAAEAALEGKAKDAELLATRKQKDNQTLQGKLDQFRPDSQQTLIRKADGNISKINTDGTLYVNIGAGQAVQPGMTFEVYGKSSGVPMVKATDETTMPIGKGSIEILRVGANYSECRILKNTPGQTMTEGDIIANLIYDRDTKLKFVIFGKYDLTKPGTPDAADATILKRLVTEWGATLDPDLTVGTDFLVIGAEPKVPDFTDEQRRDPVNAKTLADAQAEVDKYRDILNRAKDMSIPVLNQNRFLYYIGYYDSAHR